MTWSGASSGEHFVASNPATALAAGATAAGSLYIAGPSPWIDVKAPPYNAKGDGKTITNGVMNGSNAVLTSVSNPFVSTDVGKTIMVYGAGAAAGVLSTTILSFQSASQVTLAANSQTNAPGNTTYWATDDTAAIQAAINAVPLGGVPAGVVGGGVVFFPPGTYLTSTTLSQTLGMGLILKGAGKRATIIAPSTGLAGLPVINFIDHRDAMVETMCVRGTPQGTNATAAIQSTRSQVTTGGQTGANLTLKSCLLGADIDVGLETGVKWVANSTALDLNNDYGSMFDVDIQNFTVAAYSIGHANSLWHRIFGGRITGGPAAVQLFGGSFDMQGTNLVTLTTAAFDFEAPFGSGTPAYYHKSTIRAMAETASPILKAVAAATTLSVDMSGMDWKFAPTPLTTTIAVGSNGAALPQASISVAANSLPASGEVVIVTTTGNQRVTYTGGGGTATLTGCAGGTGTMATGNAVTQAILMIDFKAPGGRLAINNNDHIFGQPGCIAQFTDSASNVEFVANQRLGFQVISYNGILRMFGNFHVPSTVTPNNLGSGVLIQAFDSGGGFNTNTATGGLIATGGLAAEGQSLIGFAFNMPDGYSFGVGGNNAVTWSSTAPRLRVGNGMATSQSATAPAVATSGTIATAALGVSRVAPAGNVTAVVLAAGTVAGQLITVVNESAFTITFDVAATSNVADGATTVIPANRASSFVWDSITARWYRSA